MLEVRRCFRVTLLGRVPEGKLSQNLGQDFSAGIRTWEFSLWNRCKTPSSCFRCGSFEKYSSVNHIKPYKTTSNSHTFSFSHHVRLPLFFCLVLFLSLTQDLFIFCSRKVCFSENWDVAWFETSRNGLAWSPNKRSSFLSSVSAGFLSFTQNAHPL